MSRKILLLALVIISAGLVKGIHLLWVGNKRIQESTEAFDQRLASLEKLAAGFAKVEDDVRKLGATLAPPTGRSDAEGPEAAPAADGAIHTPEDRLAFLETEMDELAERLDGLSDDPISRGYAFLGSEFPELRREGIAILKQLARSDPEARAAIRKCLRDPNPRVREKAADTLKDVRDRESLTEILPLLGDEDARTRRRAVQAMGALGAKDAVQAVAQQLSSDQDVHIYNWDSWAQKTIPVPMVVGHEFVGVVEATGSNVIGFRPGDLVGGEGHVVCGHCRNCLAGRRHLCKDTQGVGVNRPGAFAEFVAIPVSNVWFHDRKIPLEVLSIFDPFGNAVHTALSFEVLGEDVLITGAGPIGIMAAAVVKHAGARSVVVTDVHPYRLALAMKMGATLAVDVRTERIADAQKRLGMKEGFDVGLEMSGNAQAFHEMLANRVHGGKIAMLGIPEKEMSIDWRTVVFNMLTIKGIYGREMYETWYKMTVMVQGGLNIAPVITHRFAYQEFEKGFDAIRSGSSGKVILSWE